jgi:hypothetical protein
MKIKEKLATEISDQMIINNRKINIIIGEMKENYPKVIYEPYLEKMAHMMALSFDLLDMLEKEYPHLNPYENSGKS